MSTTTTAGSLPGHFVARPNGSASYSIPLELPPGTARMMPNLILAYASSLPNGKLGVGWRLLGLSSIERCAATFVPDGFFAPVSYTDTDRFILDGARLEPNVGDYGQKTAEYRTTVESWRRVVPTYGNTRGRHGPDSWTVFAKSGHVYEYGTTADSKIAVSSENPSIRVWALSKVTDPNDNYYTISYTTDSGEGGDYYPSSIEYTSNDTGGLKANRKIKFTYESRADIIPVYRGGFPVQTRQRLSQIATSVSGPRCLPTT